MKIGLAVTKTKDIEDKQFVFTKIDNILESYFLSKNYGSGISELYIGIICVAPEFEQFFNEETKPKYSGGILEYRIKLNYNIFKEKDIKDATTMLVKDILKSVTIIEGLKAKIKDFNIQLFESDLEALFRDNGYI